MVVLGCSCPGADVRGGMSCTHTLYMRVFCCVHGIYIALHCLLPNSINYVSRWHLERACAVSVCCISSLLIAASAAAAVSMVIIRRNLDLLLTLTVVGL